ncbi:Myotubularin-related protein 13 [Portunus trituberculatus]|uniref:Myotubularin-related protein 13 n=1 Tax=Portunus trituberculatus TaxID=210409 RepID=A0A5B7EIU4_PORTR|nr:Myotubularin-related protein 13 [Portunus trituberculatus]
MQTCLFTGNGIGSGKIIQRFPERDWPDTPFTEGLELFCQPQGWALSTDRQEPKFFVSVLTDIDANRHYCAVLCFNEAVSITPSKPTDEEDDGLELGSSGVRGVVPPVPIITHHSIMYAPKCLVLISRLNYFETFRDLVCAREVFLGDPEPTFLDGMVPVVGQQQHVSGLDRIGVRERRKPCAVRPEEEEKHAISKIRRAVGMKIAIEDNKRLNILEDQQNDDSLS